MWDEFQAWNSQGMLGELDGAWHFFPGNFLPKILEFHREWDKSSIGADASQNPIPSTSGIVQSQILLFPFPFPIPKSKPFLRKLGISAPTSFPNPAGRILGMLLLRGGAFFPTQNSMDLAGILAWISSHPPVPRHIPRFFSPKKFPERFSTLPGQIFWELFLVFLTLFLHGHIIPSRKSIGSVFIWECWWKIHGLSYSLWEFMDHP